ncbi:MAG: DUF1287 domain-containing protein [Gammaproteobacteria bacterium]|nr:DUF1287 domain-containing protein [Gammaproteobacteria bacterium]
MIGTRYETYIVNGLLLGFLYPVFREFASLIPETKSPLFTHAKYKTIAVLCLLLPALLTGCHAEPEAVAFAHPKTKALVQGALTQIGKTVIYDPAYRKLDYPGGDIPIERGVCTDVAIRAFRSIGMDLQVLVHKDMRKAFKRYPQRWGLKGPDRNIDHRRVPNLQTLFQRMGKALAVTEDPADYLPGDLVTWNLPGNLSHIGIVSNFRNRKSGRFLVVHNIGAGAQLEDMLFKFEITGHYRFFN